MLIYVHTPFCRSKCHYCAFYSIAIADRPQSEAMFADYAAGLMRELAFYGKKYKGETVESVFFGGGTPSLLPASVIASVMDGLHRYFSLVQDVEITMEANPESLRKPHILRDFRACGVNRLSIGIQSLDEKMLHILGRAHNTADAIKAVAAARNAGIANVGIDLIWGLPGQNLEHWLGTLQQAVNLQPNHISAYGLGLEPGTCLERDCSSGLYLLPSEEEQGRMFIEGSAFLQANGYQHYEISNFALPGFQCRHNCGYWLGRDYCGLGPSATSTVGHKRWTNPASLADWLNMVNRSEKCADIEILTPKIRTMELIMLGLRTGQGLELEQYNRLTGRNFRQDFPELVQALLKNDLAHFTTDRFYLTCAGMLVSNSILAEFFERLDAIAEEGNRQMDV